MTSIKPNRLVCEECRRLKASQATLACWRDASSSFPTQQSSHAELCGEVDDEQVGKQQEMQNMNMHNETVTNALDHHMKDHSNCFEEAVQKHHLCHNNK